MNGLTDDTTLILVPGLRPPVPPRPDRLGKRRPAAWLARRVARTGDTALAAGLSLAAVGVAVTLSAPLGLLAAVFFVGQAFLLLTPPAVEVPRA